MEYGRNGYILTEHDEGCKLTPYQDQGGVWTVGTGHTGDDFAHDQDITQEQADAFLKHDIQKAVDGVNEAITVNLSQDEFDACVDLTFNIGVHAFTFSTVCRDLNDGRTEAAHDAIAAWDKVNGKPNRGLDHRRSDEMRLFDGEDSHGL